MDSEEQLAAMRAALIREPAPDEGHELAFLRAENDTLRHRIKVIEFENSELYRKLARASETIMELSAIVREGGHDHRGIVRAESFDADGS